jgi:uncharacterized membrane protein
MENENFQIICLVLGIILILGALALIGLSNTSYSKRKTVINWTLAGGPGIVPQMEKDLKRWRVRGRLGFYFLILGTLFLLSGLL